MYFYLSILSPFIVPIFIFMCVGLGKGQVSHLGMGGIEWKQLKKINYGQDFAQKKIKIKNLEMK